MDSVSINKGSDKILVYFMKGWKGRKVLINAVDLNKLVDYIKSENPDLIKKEKKIQKSEARIQNIMSG